MRVGLNLAFLLPGETGGRETYARELTLALARRPGLELISFVNREAAAVPGFWHEAGATVRLPLSVRSRPQWAWAEVAAVAGAAARARVDVLHSMANFGPVAGPFARVLSVHDVLHRLHPELVPAVMRLGTDALQIPAARRAGRVATLSEASRDAIVTELGLPPEHVVVIPPGIAPPAAGDAAAGRRQVDAGERPIALAVSTDLPHKNHRMLIEGLAALDPAERPVLAIAGHGTSAGALGTLASERGVTADVRLLGAVSADELEDLYAAAAGLVTATLHEGFGLPVVEAFARGLPVACSDIPVLREVGGDATIKLDPHSAASVADALRAVVAVGPDDPRVTEGRRIAATYSWTRTAERMAACYATVVGAR